MLFYDDRLGGLHGAAIESVEGINSLLRALAFIS